MRRVMLLMLLGVGVAFPAYARVALGQFDRWGAFRDSPGHCFAIAEPIGRRSGDDHPYFAISRVAGGAAPHIHVVPSRAPRPDTPLRLDIDTRPFTLAGAGGGDARADARIIAAIRHADRMRVAGVDRTGRLFHDDYPLAGAPSAIDAAILGCIGKVL